MLPSILAKQLQQGLSDYIGTTFPMTNPSFQGSLERMLKTPDAVFHEPYAAVRLPFRVAEDEGDRFESMSSRSVMSSSAKPLCARSTSAKAIWSVNG